LELEPLMTLLLAGFEDASALMAPSYHTWGKAEQRLGSPSSSSGRLEATKLMCQVNGSVGSFCSAEAKHCRPDTIATLPPLLCCCKALLQHCVRLLRGLSRPQLLLSIASGHFAQPRPSTLSESLLQVTIDFYNEALHSTWCLVIFCSAEAKHLRGPTARPSAKRSFSAVFAPERSPTSEWSPTSGQSPTSERSPSSGLPSVCLKTW
jgi:hypothetical protein